MKVKIEGTLDPRFNPVEEAFAELWSDIEVGAALSVYLNGDPVVDLWGGYKDRALKQPWEKGTLVNVYSATKGVAALTFALLVDDGKLRYEDLVTEYWPEFGQNGKQNVTIAELLSHQAGVCGVDEQLTVADLYNWEKMTNLLAAQKPFWKPGTAAGYHAVTWGYLPGEIIRRVTGHSLGQFFRQRLGDPLNLNFHIGLHDEQFEQCATLIGPNHARKQPETNRRDPESEGTGEARPSQLYAKALMNPAISPFKHACSPEWRRAELAASNGHGDADSLARLYALMANGGALGDQRFIRAATLARAVQPEVDDSIDLVTQTRIRRSCGFILSHDDNYGPGKQSFGHAGAGGSMAFADPETGLAFAYVMNQMQPDGTPARAARLIDAVYRCI